MRPAGRPDRPVAPAPGRRHRLLRDEGGTTAGEGEAQGHAAECARALLRAHGIGAARLLAEQLGLSKDQYKVSFQSRLGRAKWLQPYTEPTLVQLAADGVKRVDVMCPGFSADCLETLEEITQRGLHLRREQVAVLAQQFAVAVIKAGKTQAFAQAACLRSRCPFRRIDLTCHFARIATISNEIDPFWADRESGGRNADISSWTTPWRSVRVHGEPSFKLPA